MGDKTQGRRFFETFLGLFCVAILNRIKSTKKTPAFAPSPEAPAGLGYPAPTSEPGPEE